MATQIPNAPIRTAPSDRAAIAAGSASNQATRTAAEKAGRAAKHVAPRKTLSQPIMRPKRDDAEGATFLTGFIASVKSYRDASLQLGRSSLDARSEQLIFSLTLPQIIRDRYWRDLGILLV
jgi:hypothetical protein